MEALALRRHQSQQRAIFAGGQHGRNRHGLDVLIAPVVGRLELQLAPGPGLDQHNYCDPRVRQRVQPGVDRQRRSERLEADVHDCCRTSNAVTDTFHLVRHAEADIYQASCDIGGWAEENGDEVHPAAIFHDLARGGAEVPGLEVELLQMRVNKSGALHLGADIRGGAPVAFAPTPSGADACAKLCEVPLDLRSNPGLADEPAVDFMPVQVHSGLHYPYESLSLYSRSGALRALFGGCLRAGYLQEPRCIGATTGGLPQVNFN